MKLKTLIPFVVVLAVLGGLALFRNAQKGTPSIVEQSGLQSVAEESLSADSIKKIELHAAGTPDDKVTLQREGDAWIIASHFNAPAKKETVDDFLEKLTGIKGEPRATASGDEQLAAYSLKDDEAFRVKAYTEGDAPALELLFGKAPDFKSVFFRKAGDQQVMVEATDLRKEAGVTGEDMTTAPTPDRWMDKDILKLERDKVTKLAYLMPDKEFVLEKRALPAETPAPEETKEGEEAEPAPPAEPKFEWVASSGGLGEKVKESGLDRVFGRLQSLVASNLIDPAKKAELGLDAPSFRLAVSREGEADLVLLGAHKDPAGPGHLMIEGAAKETIYEVSKFNFEYLFLKGGDLYDLPKLELDAEAINRIELTGPEGRAVLVKEGENWRAEEPQLAFELDQAKAKELVTTVATLQMQDYADKDTGPFTHTLTVHAGDSVRTLQAGAPAAGFEGVYLKLDGDERIYAGNKLETDRLFLAPKDFYTLDAFKGMDAASINRISLKHEGKAVTLTKAGEDWMVSLDGAESFTGDANRVKGLADMLATLRFNDIHDAARAADWAPLFDIEFMTESGASHRLNVGPMEGEMHLVQLDTNASLFELDEPNVSTFKYHFNAVQTKPEPPAAVAPEEASASAEPQAAVEAAPASEEPAVAAPVEATLP